MYVFHQVIFPVRGYLDRSGPFLPFTHPLRSRGVARRTGHSCIAQHFCGPRSTTLDKDAASVAQDNDGSLAQSGLRTRLQFRRNCGSTTISSHRQRRAFILSVLQASMPRAASNIACHRNLSLKSMLRISKDGIGASCIVEARYTEFRFEWSAVLYPLF